MVGGRRRCCTRRFAFVVALAYCVSPLLLLLLLLMMMMMMMMMLTLSSLVLADGVHGQGPQGHEEGRLCGGFFQPGWNLLERPQDHQQPTSQQAHHGPGESLLCVYVNVENVSEWMDYIPSLVIYIYIYIYIYTYACHALCPAVHTPHFDPNVPTG